MKLRVEVTENDLKNMVAAYINDKLGSLEVDTSNVVIEVKSKQNYRAEWEKADYRAVVEVW